MRMDPNGTVTDAIVVMVEGNPGALQAVIKLVKDAADGFGFIDHCHLDDAEIYGSDIWLLYNDACDQNIEVMRTAIRDQKARKLLESTLRYRKIDPSVSAEDEYYGPGPR